MKRRGTGTRGKARRKQRGGVRGGGGENEEKEGGGGQGEIRVKRGGKRDKVQEVEEEKVI